MFVELRLPDLVELVQFIRSKRAAQLAPTAASFSEATPTPVRTRPLQGLTLRGSAVSLCGAASPRAGKGLGPESLPALFEEKRLLVNRGGVIEYISEGGEHGPRSADCRA